jgi:CubicO group peptidase (beta-lactamase class C family)
VKHLPALLIAATLLAPWPSLAASPVVAAQPTPELTEADVGPFLDEFFARELEPQQVVGAGVVIVQDGQVVAARGYGYADLEEKRPVEPENTLFPAQSVSKLFAATAVMQVYERGLVDLDADVRDYLGDVPLDSDFEQPVTLGHLLTHTAGFDDSYIGFLPRNAEDLLTVPEFLTRYRRRVIFEPGTVHAYTNYGSLLARHVVDMATGTRYEDYLVEKILRPLGMKQSSPLPPPPEWADRVATGYLPARDGMESTRSAFPDGLVRFRTSTGTVASTVVDMARFMIAHLEGGSIEGGRILEPETVELMHRQQFAQHPLLPGATYGFFETFSGGERGIFHFGSGFGYGTMLYLLPEHRTGLYIAHSNSASRIAEALMAAFLERYFDKPATGMAAADREYANDATHFAGFYEQARRPETTFEKLPLGLMQADLRALDSRTLANDQLVEREWLRSGPLTFERSDGRGFVAFEEDAEGRPTFASIWDNEVPQLLVLERVPWYDSTPALLARVAWFTLVFLIVVLGYPIGSWVQRRRRTRASEIQSARVITGSIVGSAALNLAFLAGLVWIFAGRQFFYSVTPMMVAVFCLPLVALVFSGLALTGSMRGRTERPAHRAARALQVVILATLVLFPLFLWRWNLLGFHF